MDQDPVAIANSLTELVVKHGLRQATAMTDTHTVVVGEKPLLWDDGQLQTEVRRHEL